MGFEVGQYVRIPFGPRGKQIAPHPPFEARLVVRAYNAALRAWYDNERTSAPEIAAAVVLLTPAEAAQAAKLWVQAHPAANEQDVSP